MIFRPSEVVERFIEDVHARVGASVVSQKQLELFSLIFSHSGTGATGLDPLQRLFAPV